MNENGLDHGHDIETDPADGVYLAYLDVRNALLAFQHALLSVSCPECDPDGSRAATVGDELSQRYDLDMFEVDQLLVFSAEVRSSAQTVLLPPPCTCDYDDEDDGEGRG